MRPALTLCLVYLACSLNLAAAGEFPRFEVHQIDPHAGEVCYAVTAADVNGDRKIDVVVLTEDAVIWYENPTWHMHDIIRQKTARDNVSIQPHDVDGDGRIDFALSAGWRPSDTRTPSTLQWLGRDREGRWQLHKIQFDEPTLHRLRWGDVKGTGRTQLVVVPLQGRNTKGPSWSEGEGVRVVVYDIPEKPETEAWPAEIASNSLHTIHGLQLADVDGDHRNEIVLAAWEGVFVLDRDLSGHWTQYQIGTGNQEAKPFKGASEVKVGRLRDGATYVATIEPWHGFQVVVYTPAGVHASAQAAPGSTVPLPGLWSRHVIAEPVQWGHTVWCADLDADGDDELVIGQRDPNRQGTNAPRGPGLFVFDPNCTADSLVFDRHTIDDGGVACEDALAVDLDADGRLDLVAGGRATHNVKIYWNRGSTQAQSPPTIAQAKIDPTINDQFRNPDVQAFVRRFESNSREPYAKRHEIVAALELKRGMAVADVGAGTGFFTRLFSEKVGNTGKVYAIDVAPQFLAHIAAESKKRGQNNVVTVRGDQDGIKIPHESVDLVFLSDVYHHLENPEKVLASIHRALRSGGSLVVMDFDKVEGKSAAFVLKHVRATKNVFKKEIETAGFREDSAAKPPDLKENFFLRFRKTAGATGGQENTTKAGGS